MQMAYFYKILTSIGLLYLTYYGIKYFNKQNKKQKIRMCFAMTIVSLIVLVPQYIIYITNQ